MWCVMYNAVISLIWGAGSQVPWSRVNIKSLPKFSVRVGVPDLVHLVDHVNHRVDVWESHVVIVVLKELFLVAQFSKIMTPSP